MGSAALAAAVPYPGKATRISCNGSKNSNKIKKNSTKINHKKNNSAPNL